MGERHKKYFLFNLKRQKKFAEVIDIVRAVWYNQANIFLKGLRQ